MEKIPPFFSNNISQYLQSLTLPLCLLIIVKSGSLSKMICWLSRTPSNFDWVETIPF